MNAYVLNFNEIDKTKLMAVGSKRLNLGQLSKIEGIRVPDGFVLQRKPTESLLKTT
ncbi:MAG: pyruvate phosphate dikinase PEP/pyruvate-binding [Clostridia bacterium]|jgi:pyruvate,water dikinase|nr:pyruvate phosphate dikinase PEP/pyruvate-binding [Clostridia bacterium]